MISPSAPTAVTGRSCLRFVPRSGRNQPSNTRFIFGPSVWLRGLIKPPPDHGVAYIDWAQQEFGIAAALSGDQAMQAAYRSGDCYLAFGKQAGAHPAGCDQGNFEGRHKDSNRSANCTSNVCWACSMAKRPNPLPHELGSQQLLRAIYYGLITKPIEHFGLV